jgi:tRNA(adenine34) deaminase
MRAALAQAELACANDEVPVGAVVVFEGAIIGRGFNQTRARFDVSAHAEIVALRAAAKSLSNYRLPGALLVCTLEPCLMCVGALVQARVATLIFGASEPKTGACGSAFDALSDPAHNHRVACEKGVLAAQSSALLQRFFANRRGHQHD